MPFSRLALTCALALLFASSAPAQEKHHLRPHWEPGKTYQYDLSVEVEASGLPAGKKMNTSVMARVDIDVRQDPGNPVKNAQAKVLSLRVLVDARGELQTFDSENPSLSDLNLKTALGPIVGQTFTLTYDADDIFKEITLPEGSTLGSPDGRRGPTGQAIGLLFREVLTGALPTAPVGLQEEYTREERLPVAPDAATIRKHTGRIHALSQDPPHATVTAEGALELVPTNPDNAPPPGSIPLFGFKAETLYDHQQKAVHRSTLTLTVKRPSGGDDEATIKIVPTLTLKGIAPTK
jgi:hypothetical protein